MLKQFGLFLLACFITCHFSATVHAAQFLVSPTDDNDCTDNVCDLQSALTEAGKNNQDDTISPEEGTYEPTTPANNLPNYNPSSSETFSLSLIGAGKGVTVIDGRSLSFQLIKGTKITIKGITFQNNSGLSISGGGSNFNNGNSIDIQDSEFINNAGVGSSAETVHIANNTFLNNDNGGLVIFAKDISVENNVFTGNSADGSTPGGAEISADNTIVMVNNLFLKNIDAAVVANGKNSGSGSVTVIANNTFVDNQSKFEKYGGSLSVSFSNDASEADIFNNIVVGSTSLSGEKIADIFYFAGTDYNHDGKGNALNLKNNDFNKLSTDCFEGCSIPKEESGTINKDPLFVDPAIGDFHLQSSSPCINAGIVDASFTLPDLDLDGNPRIFGSAPDMGTYELQSDPTTGGLSGGSGSSSGGCSLIR